MKNILDWIEEKKQQYEGPGPRAMAQEPRNMYQDGQLVRNTADGSRPGYNGVKKELMTFVKRFIKNFWTSLNSNVVRVTSWR